MWKRSRTILAIWGDCFSLNLEIWKRSCCKSWTNYIHSNFDAASDNSIMKVISNDNMFYQNSDDIKVVKSQLSSSPSSIETVLRTVSTLRIIYSVRKSYKWESLSFEWQLKLWNGQLMKYRSQKSSQSICLFFWLTSENLMILLDDAVSAIIVLNECAWNGAF